MAKLFGVHEVELKDGVTEAELGAFVKDFLKLANSVPKWHWHTVKGIRGERQGKYLFIVEAESVEERDRWFTADDEPSEEAIEFMKAHPEIVDIFEKRDALFNGFGVTYTDYVEID